MSHSSVGDLIGQRLPNTLAVVGVAYVLGVAMGIPVGMISAIKRYSIFDHAATTVAFMGFSVPTFFTGLVLIIIFGINLRWFPFIYSSTLQIKDLDSFWLQIRQSIMPITVLALFNVATIARYVRSEMLEHLPLDYVRTARSKGLVERLVVLRHVLRNSLIPVVTLVALGVPTVFGGAIVTEQMFRVPGTGELVVTSISNRDTPGRATVVFISAVLIATTLGTLIGALAGYFNKLDNPLMRLTDLFLSLPILPLLLIVIYLFRDPLRAAFGPEVGIFIMIVTVIGVLEWMPVARLVRAQFLSLKHKEFVEAARAIGDPDFAIIWRHILPNTLSPVLVAATIGVGGAILTESTLSFLGLGFPPDVPTWGRLLYDAQNFIELATYWVVFPGFLIFVTVLSINYIGDGLRDALDPRKT